MNRGICYFETNQFQNAKADFERTLELDPDNKTARQFLDETNNAIAYYDSQKKQAIITTKLDETTMMLLINRCERQRQLEQQIIDNRRNQEAIFWGTVIPIVFWSTVFLTW